MATATKPRTDRTLTSSWAVSHLAGPFDVWNPGARKDKQHHYARTLIAARLIAECESADEGRAEVLDAERHLIGWARDGRWHGPEVA